MHRGYEEPYALVADKVSQSAAIMVRLPKGISVAEAADRVSFEPSIEGKWLASGSKDTLLFKPNDALPLGKYFTATLAVGETRITKDFQVDEDPRVIAVFPASSTPASEYSEITIIFNRPMVPLTSLEVVEKDISQFVEITPRTRGRFKWITTRNLQFIPKERLVRAAHYRVRVKSGFTSVEGIAVPEATYEFKTRPLAFLAAPEGVISYHEPARFVFNQPVDLERTRREISLKDDRGEDVPFSAAYGVRILYDGEGNERGKVTDKGLIEVRPQKDRLGREGLWDFKKTYFYRIDRAYPLEGDIVLEEARNGLFATADLIESVVAESPRSKHVSADLFDPQGSLVITFSEKINKRRSEVSAPHLTDVAYGESCKTDEHGNVVYTNEGCEKAPDHRKLKLKFDAGAFRQGDALTVSLRKLVNEEGFALTSETLTISARIYPTLRITKTVPANGARDVPPEEVKLCSTTPLTPATEENFRDRFSSSWPIGRWNWYEPWRVTGFEESSPCAVGEFENTIRVGLAPERLVAVSVRAVDDFGQKAETSTEFVTGKVPEENRNFYSLQKIYNVTSPERTKLTYAVENLRYVNLHLCRVTAEDMFRLIGSFPPATSPPSSLPCMETIERRIDLPDRFWTRNYFTVKLSDYLSNPIGHYILSFSNPDYRRVNWEWNPQLQQSVRRLGGQVYERTFVSVTRLAVVEKRVERNTQYGPYDSAPALTERILSQGPQSLYWVAWFGSAEPVAGARVIVYGRTSSNPDLQLSGDYIPLAEAVTAADGIAWFSAFKNVQGAIIREGEDSAIVSAATDKFQLVSSAASAARTYLYTDRPIYRPGDEVFLKGIYRLGYDGAYEIPEEKPIRLTVRDSRWNVVHEKDIRLNDYGTFTDSFRLDANAPLGTYRIETLHGYASFDVEEYAPAAFKIELMTDREEYIASGEAKISVDANYYFGVPVEGGEAIYTITSQDYYFDRYQDGWFNFGGNWYYDYSRGYGDKFVTRGTVPLSEKGKATIVQKLDFRKLYKEEEGKQSKIFVVNVTVRNRNGQSVSAQKSFIVHRGEFYLGLNIEKTFAGKGEKLVARVKSVDTKGNPVSKNGIAVEIRKIRWESFRRREVDGRFYHRSERKKEVIERFTVATDSTGDDSFTWSVDKEGEYEVGLAAEDGRGNIVVAEQSFYIYGKGQVEVRPTNNEALDLAADRTEVNVEEKASFVIKSPFERSKALVAIERGKIFDYRVIDIKGNLARYEFDVKEEYAPNVFASVILLSPKPEVKFGQIAYRVAADRVALTIDLATHKTSYLPHEDVTLTVRTKNWQGRGVPAEVSLAVTDVSVLALKGNQKKNPLVFFYGGLPLTVTTASNVKNILSEAEIPTGTKGGGSGEPEGLAQRKRGEFRDTAFWRGVVRTDARGEASVTFTLPDNLTTWQVESVGITTDTKVGAGYVEFVTKKELMIVPLRPRFVTPGDEFSIGAKVLNQTDESLSLRVRLESETLETDGAREAKLTLRPHTSDTVYFDVRAPELVQDGIHHFILKGQGGEYEDAVEQAIPIVRNNTYETTATAGYTTAKTIREYIYVPAKVVRDRGGVNVKVSATLAVFLSDALKYLVEYPYGGTEETASKLSGIAVVKRGLKVKNLSELMSVPTVTFAGKTYTADEIVAVGLARLYENQYPDGSVPYYKGLTPSYYLTLHVLDSFLNLRDAGYAVETRAIDTAANYLYRELTSRREFYENPDLVALSAYTLSRLPQYASNEFLVRKISEIMQDSRFLREKLSSISLAKLAILTAWGNYPETLKELVYRTLENRIEIDSRGAYLSERDGHSLYEFHETPIKDTALFLKAYVIGKRESPVIDKVLQWILRSRAKDGAWGSTQNTLAVIDAFTDFLNSRRETESSFTARLLVDKTVKESFDVNPKTILQVFSSFVATKSLAPDIIHTFAIEKENRNAFPNAMYYDIDFRYYLPVEIIPPRDEGFAITREFFALNDKDGKSPLREAKQGEVVRGRLTITVPEWRNFVAIENFIPAGFELVNFRLATEDTSLRRYKDFKEEGIPRHGSGQGAKNEYALVPSYNGRGVHFAGPSEFSASLRGALGWMAEKLKSFGGVLNPFESVKKTELTVDEELYGRVPSAMDFLPDAEEIHDSRLYLWKERVAPGVYTYDYFGRALVPGTYHHLPAVVSELYFPENFGRTRGETFTITR